MVNAGTAFSPAPGEHPVSDVVRLLTCYVTPKATDVWEKDVLQDFISGVAKQISYILEE